MKHSNTTRYLCAAAQLDRAFRSQVLEQIIDEEHRVINIPAGVDLLSVAKHCLDAKRRKLIRNVVISIFFVQASIDAYQTFYVLKDSFSNFDSALLMSILSIYISFYFILAWVAVAFETWATRYQIFSNLLKTNFNPDCVFLRTKTDNKLCSQLSGILNEEECNVVVYSGFSPFVGSGIDIGGWSFAINTSQGKKGVGIAEEPEPFTIQELYRHIDSDINKLNLQGTSIQDKIFVNGQQIREDQRFLPDPLKRPLTRISLSDLTEIIGNQSALTRHYKCIRIIDWQGEIIFSVFLRFVQLRQNLFIEASYFLLTPLKQEYRKIDEIQPNPTWQQRLKLIQNDFIKALFLFPGAIILLSGELFIPLFRWNKRRAKRRLIRENPIFDYGAVTSVRELASSNLYSHYFQKLDTEMFLKIVEKQILDTLVDFLDDRHIDTSDLRSRQDTILNNGVIVSGGSITTDNLTVGERAKSVMNKMAQGVSSITGGDQTSRSKN